MSPKVQEGDNRKGTVFFWEKKNGPSAAATGKQICPVTLLL